MSEGHLPPPLIPSHVDLRDFAFMPVEVRRLLTSETWMIGTGDERSAAMALWLESWHQVPAGSLPDNERMLAHLAQAGAAWKRARAHVLRSWQRCSDGRLYHPVVCSKALEAWLEKLAQRLSSGAGNAKRWGTEFDPAAIEAEIAQAVEVLARLDPQSKAITKHRGKASRRDGDTSQQECQPESRRDRKRQGQGQGERRDDTPPHSPQGGTSVAGRQIRYGYRDEDGPIDRAYRSGIRRPMVPGKIL